MTPNGDTPTPRNTRIEWENLMMWADHYGTLARVARLNHDHKTADEYQELANRANRDLARLETQAKAKGSA